ncbi:hypothetical protein SLEP1_g44357 [Rubroshorea leprosula]|uniref:Uncharacterized protein n=1 Tax=Rubroshorea leprosula TaxID=152421 RepID=A0AAV5LH95_9ROSI|nr:hypothetical protein SLEP1_g44357 [Rubroshorea leprosula]
MAAAQPAMEDKASSGKLDKKGSRCMIDCRDIVKMEILLEEQVQAPKRPEDVDVDIINCIKETDIRPAEIEDPDATECSSSFADTTSDTEKHSGPSDAEEESQFFGDEAFGSAYDAFSNVLQMRKKKLTSHWRSFIRPLMWRCKWTELRIKEIESQALKYSRELEAYNQAKHSLINQCIPAGFSSKSLPYPNQYCRKKFIKRRKRKKVEETTDITSYMSRHNLFSYLEKKKSNQDSTADDFTNAVITDQHAECSENFGINNDQMLLELGDGDDNSLERVLWNIETAHSHIQKLRNKLDMILSKNASKFSSSENLSLLAPCEAQTSSGPSPTFSAGNGDVMSVGAMYNAIQHNVDYDITDFVMPGSAVSSYREAFHVPDIIESTVGLLSSADVTFHQAQIGDLCEDIVDNVLIHNEGVHHGDTNTFVTTNNQSVEKLREPENVEHGKTTVPSLLTSEPDPVAKTTMSQEQSTLRTCLASDINFPKNKRKRGERKAGSGGWNKKHSGDPDSQ